MMVSESMVEDQSEGSQSNAGKSIHPDERFDDYAPKARKPYTITKQRERWTEEEHKKFLEALKLYGRAWRRIEEHVGTKTAVQIRSHAQKFFSKVVRESGGSNGAEVKPIEIPPPRPKRKPTHPYPRKLAAALVKTARSGSPNSSGSDQDNRSPTSVLSAGGSNTFALGDSSENGVKPSDSSENGVKPAESGGNEPSPLVEENDSSVFPKTESCYEEEKGCTKESSTEAASTQSLKLFGTTVLVTDSHRPAADDHHRHRNGFTPTPMPPMHALPCGPPVYYMQFLDESSDSTLVSSSATATPLWSLYGGLSYPFVPLSHPVPPTNQCGLNEETEDKDTQNEGSTSLTGSNGGSYPLLTGSNGGSSGGGVTKKVFTQRCSGSGSSKCVRRGFVPYKRCLAERSSSHSSIVTGEEREEQRVRLCL